MSQNGKLMRNLDQQSTKLLNLTVLQRIDRFVEEILITAAHVSFYEFNIDLNRSSRKDVEGPLFVVQRILNAYSKVPQESKVSSTKRQYAPPLNASPKELEAVPTMAVMDGPLEPSPPTALNAADVSDDPSFVNFFCAAMIIENRILQMLQLAEDSSTSLPVDEATPVAPSLQLPSHYLHP